MNLNKLLIIFAVAAILVIPGGQFISAGVDPGPSGGDDYLVGDNGGAGPVENSTATAVHCSRWHDAGSALRTHRQTRYRYPVCRSRVV